MKKQGIQHRMDGLAALLLFSLFASCVLIVLLTGADAYRRLTARDEAVYDRRTRIQYVSTRIRQADTAGGLTIESFEGSPALLLSAGDGYATHIYCHDGYLMELYAADGGAFAESGLTPEDGTPIIEADELRFNLENDMLSVVIVGPEGSEDTLRLCLRSAKEAVK